MTESWLAVQNQPLATALAAGLSALIEVSGTVLPEVGERILVGAGATPLSIEDAWAVIVATCGARPDGLNEFRAYAQQTARAEFRLGGLLGFGGKLWYDQRPGARERWRVSCYPEDRTPERDEAVGTANALLTAPLDQVVGAVTVKGVLEVVGNSTPEPLPDDHLYLSKEPGQELRRCRRRPTPAGYRWEMSNYTRFLSWHPSLAPGARVLLVGDPVPADEKCPGCGGRGRYGVYNVNPAFHTSQPYTCSLCNGAGVLSVPFPLHGLAEGLHRIDLAAMR